MWQRCVVVFIFQKIIDITEACDTITTVPFDVVYVGSPDNTVIVWKKKDCPYTSLKIPNFMYVC